MRTRAIILTTVSLTLLASCAASPTRSIAFIPPPNQAELRTALDRGEPLNATTGRYGVGEANVELTKIVQLAGNVIGLRLEISAPGLRACCGIFPRLALDGQPGGTRDADRWIVDVAEPGRSISAEHPITFRMFGDEPERKIGSFTIDLSALGVTS